MRTPPLLADFIHPRNCKPICEKLLTLPISGGQGSAIHGDILQGVPAQIQAALTRGTKPFEKAVQEIPADKTVWYELPAQAVEIKTAVVGFCSYSGCFYL